MEENIRGAREDIALIKRMLEKTTAGMRTVAPYFIGFGVIWLVYGVLSAVSQLFFAAAPAFFSVYSSIMTVMGWTFYGVLAAGFHLCRRRLARQGLTPMALRLLDLWGVCIYLFLGLSVVLNLVPAVAVQRLSANLEQVRRIAQICAHIRSSLFFLLPALPLLMTAIFLEDRRMLRIGAVLAVMTALFLGFNILGSNTHTADISMALVRLSTGVAVLLDILPGVMLLLFGRALKRA